MGKKIIILYAFLFFLVLATLSFATTFQTTYNPFTGKLDYYTTDAAGNLSVENITASGNISVSEYFIGNGSLITDIVATGGNGTWRDGGTYLFPNSSYAVNVWIESGYLNVTSWFRAYGNSEILGDLNVTGNLNVSGDIYGTDANFTGNIRGEGGFEMNNTFNHTDTESYFRYDENGALIVHLEQ